MKPASEIVRQPNVGELWRTTMPVTINGGEVPAGSVALILRSRPTLPAFPNVLDIDIMFNGERFSVYSNHLCWEIVGEAG